MIKLGIGNTYFDTKWGLAPLHMIFTGKEATTIFLQTGDLATLI